MATHTQKLMVRVSDQLAADVETAADGAAISVSDWLRRAIENELQRSPGSRPEEFEAYIEVGGKSVPLIDALRGYSIRRREK